MSTKLKTADKIAPHAPESGDYSDYKPVLPTDNKHGALNEEEAEVAAPKTEKISAAEETVKVHEAILSPKADAKLETKGDEKLAAAKTDPKADAKADVKAPVKTDGKADAKAQLKK